MDILISRRNFLAGAAAFSLSGCVGGRGGFGGRPNLRFGVISDIHITDWASTSYFRKTLAWYRDQLVDAVMIVGDMADHGIMPQLESVAKAWYEVFPNDRAPDGRHVEKLFVYGNHDPEGLNYRDKWMDKAFAVHGLSYEQAKPLELRAIGLDKAWEKCFHEPYTPIYRKNVKGYDFVGGHWDNWHGINGLEDWFKANIAKIDTGKPFFYFQHAHPRNTVYGSWAWGHDDGQSTRALSPYANAVAFSGHSHTSLTDERSVWRGAFTSIGTSSLSYVCLNGPRENADGAPWGGDKQEPTVNVLSREGVFDDTKTMRQGQLVTVYDDRLVIRRRDFARDEDLDTAWTLEMPTRESSFSARAAASAAPAFSADAKAKVALGRGKNREGKEVDQVTISFPPATAEPQTRAFEYELTLEARIQDVEATLTSVRFYAPTVLLAKPHDAKTQSVQYALSRSLLPKNGEFRFAVRPLNSYGRKGEAIHSDWSSAPKNAKA